MSIFSELWAFLKVRKKMWLLPIIILMILLGAIIILGQNAMVGPFLYTLF